MSASLAIVRPRPDRAIMAVIFTGAIVAAWAMLPGESERVAMLERDGHSREALELLEHDVETGDTRYRTLHQILGLYENEGDVAKAQGALETMVRERPRDPALKRRQALFYKNIGKYPEYIAALQDLVEIRYSEPVCRELIAELRFMGDVAAEQNALQRCRQKGYRRPEDLSRLAELVAVDGDNAQAVGILKSIDDLKRLKTTRERYQLVQLLLEQEQPKEAERRVLRWIRSARDDNMAIGLIDLLARSKFPDTAIEVAKDAGSPGDSISLTVAERLIERAQNGAALLYLRGWLDRAQNVVPETAIRFVDAGLAAGDPLIALRGARQFGFVQISERSLLALAAALDQLQAKSEADEVRAAMAGGGPVNAARPAVADVAQPSAGSPEKPTNGGKVIEGSPRVRPTAPIDPLESWRKSLFSSMSSDAQRRMQALFVGPKPPPGYVANHREGTAKLLKKTSRVLLRNKKLSSLKAKRKASKSEINSPQQKTIPGKPQAKGNGQ